MTAVFTHMPKTARFNRPVIVTEKIDGTNACVLVDADGRVRAGSKNQELLPGEPDNKGFRAWVEEHQDMLRDLGPGLHRGEWWGKGIGRKYNGRPRCFSLFNVCRWMRGGDQFDQPVSWTDYKRERKIVPTAVPVCCDVVPVLGVIPGPSSAYINDHLATLRERGSVAAPGFMRPEGIILFHTASQEIYKITLENDESGKDDLSGL